MPDLEISLRLSRDEALVFFEWLCELEKLPSCFRHPAEQHVAWKIESSLEKLLIEPLQPNYAQLLADARKRVGESMESS